ncbi:MAG: hypothetical protein HY897_05050 [Deltaproteobacteria bacterium]|nr:hypothetical protein [Deltaproteobacteria bacterium]
MTRSRSGALILCLTAMFLFACDVSVRETGGGAAGPDAGSRDSGLPPDAGTDGGGVPDSGPKPDLCGAGCTDLGGDCADCDCCNGLPCDEGTCVSCIAKDRPCAFDAECCPSSDPSKGMRCGAADVCAECSRLGGLCTSDLPCCWESARLNCSDEGVCVIHCDQDKDCAPGEVCVSTEVCLPSPCSADSECGGRRCCAGRCADDCGYGPATACAIITRGGVVSADRTVQLVAVATNATGDIVTGQTI